MSNRFNSWKVIGFHGKSCTSGWGYGHNCTALEVQREWEVRGKKAEEKGIGSGRRNFEGGTTGQYPRYALCCYMLWVTGFPLQEQYIQQVPKFVQEIQSFPLWVSAFLTLSYKKNFLNPNFYFWLLYSLLNYNLKYLKVSSIHNNLIQ